jgi:hypothetical protein
MKHRDVAVILATGGMGLVRAAYSAGKPAYGVGPGNAPCFIERSADLGKAAADIITGKAFDNGVLCSSPNSVVVESAVADEVKREFIRQGAHFLSPGDAARLAGVLVTPQRLPNTKLVGKSAKFIAGREDVAGREMAKDAVNFCKGKNPCEIGIVEGIRADQSGAEENKAFRAYVGKYPNIKIVGQAETQYDPAKALSVATDLLTAHPGIDYLYAWWDPGGAAAVKAIQAAGKLGKIGVASQNGDCIALGLVLKGHQTVTAAFFPSAIGGGGVTAAVDAIKGKKLPKWTVAPVIGITTKSANDWLAGKLVPAAARRRILQRLKNAKAGKRRSI